MRILVVSDIHSNLEALTAVVEDAGRDGAIDELWCLGDTVGYGPDPGECIRLVREFPSYVCIAGNHDLAAIGKMGTEEFNYAAAHAAHWTAAQLSSEEASFLADLPLVVGMGKFTLVHGSLRSPVWEYLMSAEAAGATFQRMTTPYCLVGHSHIPFLCVEGGEKGGFAPFPLDTKVGLGEDRLIINPGGVGQPRDGDPRSSYVIYDSQVESVERRRVAYDISATQEKMRRAGLPAPLIDRLEHGR